MVGIAFSIKPTEAYYIPIPKNQEEAQSILHEFKEILEDEKIEKIEAEAEKENTPVFATGIPAGHDVIVIANRVGMDENLLIFSGGKADAIKLTLTTALSACLIGVLGAMAFSEMPAVDDIANALPSVAIGGLIYVLPILLVTMWSAQILPPALLSFLLTAEILSGVLSGVILLSAPFAGFQAVGAMFIIAGAAVELVLSRAIPSETTTENVGNSG